MASAVSLQDAEASIAISVVQKDVVVEQGSLCAEREATPQRPRESYIE
jgi:hypothetical protein